jgi:hypothetical protein
VLLAPSLAWRRERPWAPLVRMMSPELGLVQITPRWIAESISVVYRRERPMSHPSFA